MSENENENNLESVVLKSLDDCIGRLNEAHRSLRMWADDSTKLNALQEHTLAIIQHSNTSERVVESSSSLAVALKQSVSSLHRLLDEISPN